MRIYSTFREALNEIRRDLKEMGIPVVTGSWQDKTNFDLESGRLETLELQNYIYTVTMPHVLDLNPNQPWAEFEFRERTEYCINPGTAWEYRPDVWGQFLEKEGYFSYTYSKRLNDYGALQALIANFMADPYSRQHYLSIWDRDDVHQGLGKHRVPCTLGYHFQYRAGKLNIVYIMRSSDFITHFHNDLWLARRLQEYVAERTHLEPGNFTHFVMSLHVFKSDVEGVF